MHTKIELQMEMRAFLEGYAESIERIYGGQVAKVLAKQVDASPLWSSIMKMFDYGVQGQPVEGLGGDDMMEAEFQDAQFFLLGLDSLADFLDEDGVALPQLAMRTVRICCARHQLDGGVRSTNSGNELSDGYLTFAEVAMLADMDEKSVRNAAYADDASRLVTEKHGKQVRVSLEEARKWLVGRKGFIPSKSTPTPAIAQVSVRPETLDRLQARASAAGMTVAEFIDHLASV